MIERIKKWILKVDIEERIFLIALAISLPYFVANIIFDLWVQTQIQYLYLDSGLLVICLLFIYLKRFSKLRSLLMNVFSVIILTGFLFFWITSGGVVGGAAYIFPVLAVFTISITKGISRYFFLVLFVSLVFILTADVLQISGEAIYKNLLFEFFMNFIMLGLIFIIFKFFLDHERFDLEVQSIKIKQLNQQLSQKSSELEDYNHEIRLIQQNLESLVDKRSALLEEEYAKNVEYAFINAHLVRAPIANILALTQHLKQDDQKSKALKEHTQALDTTVRKIGEILSSK